MSLARESDALREVLATRLRNTPLRVAMPLLIAASFTFLVGPAVRVLWVWALGYAALQAVEYGLSRRLLASSRGPLPPRLRVVAVALMALSSIGFILGAAVLLGLRLTLAPSLSVLIAAGALLNSIVVSRRSLSAFLALNLPHFAWLLAMPVLIALRGPGVAVPLAPAVAMGGALLCVSATLAWISLSRALHAAAAARAEAEARRAEAEAARDGRAAFTAAVSHELRTPLSAILAASAALEMRALNEEARDSAALIADASRLMRRMLDELLDLSKLEAGRMTVEAAPLDLPLLVDETLRLWGPEAAAKGLALSVDGRETLPARASGDAMRLRQVLNNLLSNAIKFTAKGEVRLRLACAADEAGFRVRMTVADTGPGLDADTLERLFTPFEQASAGVAHTHGGTGLGLAISRELARLMGGDLVASQRADALGACFTLDVLLGLPAAPEAAPLPALAPASPRVLVADDHPLGRQAVAMLLGLRGLEVVACDDGASALGALATGPFDLVLADLNMGALGGLELTRRLRASPGPNRDTPVLAVSGDTGAETLAACLTAGMAGLAPKPLEPRSLYAAVDAALAGGRVACNDADSLDSSAASSFSSHSQTVSTVQPPASSAA